MTKFALTDVRQYVHGYDFTGQTNEATLTMEAAELDKTTFGSGGSRELTGGLKTTTLNVSGFFDAAATGSVDSDTFNGLAGPNQVFTTVPEGTEQSVAYLYRAGRFSYQLLGSIGELAPFSLTASGTDGVGAQRGQLAVAKQNVSSTGAVGSAVNLGAGSSGEFLYMTFHVFTAATTISVKVESDDAEGFATPADVTGATVGPVTTRGGTWMARVDASSFTDTWYRVNVTAITGTFSIAAALAIQ